jgi:hypothetical protein
MIGFKEFLTEVFDQPYNFNKHEVPGASKLVRDSVHNYKFTTDNGQRFNTQFLHHNGSDFGDDTGKATHAELSFSQGGTMSATGREGASAHRVFSTVHSIVKQHLTDHPHIKTVEFTGAKKNHGSDNYKDTGRQKLYTHMLRKITGVKPGEPNKHHESNDDSVKEYSFNRDQVA